MESDFTHSCTTGESGICDNSHLNTDETRDNTFTHPLQIRLEFEIKEEVMAFHQVFLISPLQCNCTVDIRKRLCEFEEIYERLREFEEIEISRQSCRGDC